MTIKGKIDDILALESMKARKPKKARRRAAKRLTEKFVRSAPPGFYCDALTPTLNLLVTDKGSRRFVQRLMIGGTQRTLGLGGWPVVTLPEARDAALDNRRAVRAGRDPRTRHPGSASPPFGKALIDVLALRAGSWKGTETAKRWRQRLEKHAGDLLPRPVGNISVDDVLNIIRPLWNEKQKTAEMLRLHIDAVMEWAIAKGYREDNPAKVILAVLPKTGKPCDPRKAVPLREVPEVVSRIREMKGGSAVKLGFEFLIHTATRTAEVRGATWGEIEGDVWTVPGGRMKTSRTHRVPLSGRALEILDEARGLRDKTNLIFPSTRRRQLSNNAFQRILKALGINATPHGFRSSFRDWCAEAGWARNVSEAALAHVVGGVEGAYYRTKHFEERQQLMKQWSEYIK